MMNSKNLRNCDDLCRLFLLCAPTLFFLFMPLSQFRISLQVKQIIGNGQRMVPWLVVLELLAFHALFQCALPWGIPTRFTIRPLTRLYYANDKKPLTEQAQEKKSRPFWGDIFNKLRKAITTPEVKDVATTAIEEIDRVAGKELDYVIERGKKDINATIEQKFSFSPTLQQILWEMKIKAEEDIKTVGTFFRGENGGEGADKAVRVVYRGDRENEGAEDQV